ncbi:hypothetical protein [Legionella fallonii]|uniref:Uncharacterized protein n=1 Tax=Legionella fallonii LLAP-10 TaxID=1212491 RepID=A0A098G5D9_9GAMM|nr:hypothetical protein [Legionella fallonii]CEG57708.1 conserved protein of unknown function [Legionella fallonii LLAP-10]
MPKVKNPAQILKEVHTKLTSMIKEATNAGKSPEEQAKTLNNAIYTYKTAMDNLKTSVLIHHTKYKEVDGLKVFSEDKLQDKLYSVLELGEKAHRLQREAGVAVNEAHAEKQQQAEQAKKQQEEEQAKKQQEEKAAEEALQAVLAAEAKEQQAKKNVEQKKASVILKKIDAILWSLHEKTNEIGGTYPEAHTIAEDLHNTLTEARDEYGYQLANGVDYDGNPISFEDAGDLFKETCQAAVESATPALEKDLGWGEFLKNILKAIVNAVFYVATIGNVSGFFAYSKGSADKVAVINEELQDLDVSKPSFN